jgi:hypothetical protein
MTTTYETNPIINHSAYEYPAKDNIVEWNDPSLKRITRLRLVSDWGFPCWDVSYCHGELHDGTIVRVHLPFYQLEKYGDNIYTQIIRYAKNDKVYAKGLGVFEAISTFNAPSY